MSSSHAIAYAMSEDADQVAMLVTNVIGFSHDVLMHTVL